MPCPERVFLVGPMGAGKSTLGRRLAEALGMDFLDSDQEIERRTGVDIPRIFDVEGEAGFRSREAAVIDELSQRPATVLATGGGAVLDPHTRARLRERGVVVYLRTPVERQFERTRHDRSRPLLNTDDRRTRLETLMQERGPLYEAVAHVTVDSDGSGPRRVLAEVLAGLDAASRTEAGS